MNKVGTANAGTKPLIAALMLIVVCRIEDRPQDLTAVVLSNTTVVQQVQQ